MTSSQSSLLPLVDLVATDSIRGLGNRWDDRSPFERVLRGAGIVLVGVAALGLMAVGGLLNRLGRALEFCFHEVLLTGLVVGIGIGWGLLHFLLRLVPHQARWENALMLGGFGLMTGFMAVLFGAVVGQTWNRVTRANAALLTLCLAVISAALLWGTVVVIKQGALGLF